MRHAASPAPVPASNGHTTARQRRLPYVAAKLLRRRPKPVVRFVTPLQMPKAAAPTGRAVSPSPLFSLTAPGQTLSAMPAAVVRP